MRDVLNRSSAYLRGADILLVPGIITYIYIYTYTRKGPNDENCEGVEKVELEQYVHRGLIHTHANLMTWTSRKRVGPDFQHLP